MFREPPFSETIQYLTLNIISAFLCAAAHNALYFMLGLTTWAFHFMHHFFTFLMLLLSYMCGLIPKQNIPTREILPIALTQLAVTIATGIIHNGGKDGALYTLRLSDFVVTLFVLHFGPRVLDASVLPANKKRILLMTIGVSSSLAWLEFKILDYNIFSVLVTPILTVATALHVMFVFQKQQKLGCHTDLLMLYVCGLTSFVLMFPAVFFTHDTFNKEMLGVAASWEIIDFALLSMAVVFMVGLTYSKYWLMANCSPEVYLVMRHSKYTLAACGQWFTQNLANVTAFSVVGKAVSISSITYYAYQRFIEWRSVQRHTVIPTTS